MFDLIQLKSGIGKENLQKDIEYINELAQITLYEYGNERLDNEFLDTISEINKKTHIHLDNISISRVTEESIKSWNSTPIAIKKTSQLVNDVDYATKAYVDKELERYNEIILTSSDGGIFLITINDDGKLKAKQIG